MSALKLALVAAGAAAVVLLLLKFPSWLVDQAHGQLNDTDRIKAITEERRTVLAVLAAIGAAVTLWYTHQCQELDRDANRTDRYTKAVEQLGDDAKPSVQLGGVYALERVAKDSPRDRAVSIEVLSAFVRQQSKAGAAVPDAAVSAELVDSPAPTSQPEDWSGPHAEPVVAALSVLARRPRGDRTYPPPNLAGADLRGANLAETNLAGADLGGANLGGADLAYADLSGAHLNVASLLGADLTPADLTRANLTEADARTADLIDANLTDALLIGADLTGADLIDANLTGADLRSAKLSDAKLPGVNLHGIDLTGADLIRADLIRADLADANLTRANLTDADLTDANLTGANLTDATLPQGWKP